MKTTTVPSSQIAQYGRWDAAFHLAVADTKEQAQLLRNRYTADALIAKLSTLSTQDLKALAPLLRGQQQVTSKEALFSAIKEYPFIAFALVQADIDARITAAQAEVTEQLARVAQLAGIKEA
jgi:hypothetical protein